MNAPRSIHIDEDGKPLLELHIGDDQPAIRIVHQGTGNAIEVVDVQGNQLGSVSNDGAGFSPDILPSALGLKAWSFHPSLAQGAGTNSNTHLSGVYLKKGTTISKMACFVTIVGAGLTMARLGIYDKSFNLVAQTGNTAGDITKFQTLGWAECDLTTPWTAPASDLYYFAGGWLGTTLPTVTQTVQKSGIASLPNGNLLGVHAQVPSGGALPNPAVKQGEFTGYILYVAR